MTFRRRWPAFFGFLATCLTLVAAAGLHARLTQEFDNARLERNRALVERLGLTDLCLFTDARYTRNPAMADLHSPFQDSPRSLEHFPSGSLLPPPPHLASHEDDS